MKIGNLEVYGVIYKITNKINGKVYIGQTTHKKGFDGRYRHKGKGIERVYKYHISQRDSKREYNKYLLNAIEKYGLDNFIVDEIFDMAFSKYELNIKEISFIKLFNSYKRGYNMTNGAEGQIGMFGKENNNSKSIIQLTLQGDYIRKWDSVSEACKGVLGTPSGISQNINKSTKSAYGFIWIKEEEYNSSIRYEYINETGEYNKEPVVKLSLNGEFIKLYNSISEASEFESKSIKGISKCCNGVNKSYLGFIWIKEEDYLKERDYSKMLSRNYSKIYKLDINNNVLCIYDNAKEVFENEGINTKNVSKLCLKHKHSKEGIMWCYEDFYNTEIA